MDLLLFSLCTLLHSQIMSPVAFSFLLPSFLLFVNSLEEKPSKPPCLPFKCGKFSIISFPFAEFHNPPCGLILVECSVDERAKIRSEDGNEYSIKSISKSGDSFTVENTLFWQLKKGDCDIISKFAVPTFPGLVSKISAPYFMTIYICQHRLDNPSLKLISSCKDSNMYFFPTLLLGPKAQQDERAHDNTLPDCSTVNFPLSQKPKDLEWENTNLSSSMDPSFHLEWGINKGCIDCQHGGGHCGLDIHRNFSCYCKDGQGKDCSTGKKNVGLKIIIGISASAGTLLLTGAAFFVYYRRRKMKQTSPSSLFLTRSMSSDPPIKPDHEKGSTTQFLTNMPTLSLFTYKELEQATNSFNPSNELGDGGFGTVYYGKLRDGRSVAVKRLYENNYKRVEQFMNEVKILSGLRHQNLVCLYGCTSRHSRELLLVYEYIPNGTVADHLHGDLAKVKGGLNWSTRLKIALETAEALAFLHAVEPPIIHRDVKTNNILLDNSYQVKVADFGLSRLFPLDATHVSTAPQGTPGYVDPDYHQCYQLTDKSDVYSFGVVLVELISSKPAVDITRHRHEINLANLAINKIINRALSELVDQSLGFESDFRVRRMMTGVAELAFRCLSAEKEERPTMEEVLEILRGIEKDGIEGKTPKEQPEILADDVVLLKSQVPFSPDSVTEKWASRSTTPNTSNEG